MDDEFHESKEDVLSEYHPKFLPVEVEPVVPEDIVAQFDGTTDRSDPTNPLSANFQILGQNIQMDDSNKAFTPDEVLQKFNEVTYGSERDTRGKAVGRTYNIMTCGMYARSRRYVVTPDSWGLVESFGRFRLLPPGIHVLYSAYDKWMGTVDLEEVRKGDGRGEVKMIGSKYILFVPENCIAGASRVDVPEEGEMVSRDAGDYVLFSQGYHVLDATKYQNVTMKKMIPPRVDLGPVTLLYVYQGNIGGAYHKQKGRYEILYPGRPYLLHEKFYVDVSLATVSMRLFELGPYQFVTVPEGGFVGGSFRKEGGTFQVLPPGKSYQLHSKDYDKAVVVQRSDKFSLGPFWVVTVRKGFVAGAYHLATGEFHVFPVDKTYWLPKGSYYEPEVVHLEGHVTNCGPLTLLTTQEGMLSGAYEVATGEFVEFDQPQARYVLHSKDYHGLVMVEKFSEACCDFGPYKVITVREGFAGVFENAGKIEIKGPGFYKMEAQYNIRDPISLQKNNFTLQEEFRTTEGVRMNVKAVLTYIVQDASIVALRNCSMDELNSDIHERSSALLVRLCRQYRRAELLPTVEDKRQASEARAAAAAAPPEASARDMGVGADEYEDESQQETARLYNSISQRMIERMQGAMESGGYGVQIMEVDISGFELLDTAIIKDLQEITQSRIATETARVRGEQMMAEEASRKLVNERRAEAEAEARMANARANTQVLREEAEAAAEASLRAARAASEAQALSAKAAAQSSAAAREIELEIELKQLKERAEAEAMSITTLAEANYTKALKEHEAQKLMPQQQFDLLMADRAVEAVKNFGESAWRHPHEMSELMSSFLPFVKVGPASLGDLLQGVQAKQSGKK